MKVTIEKYKQSRFWAVYITDSLTDKKELLACVVYKKGAEAVKVKLDELWDKAQWIIRNGN